MGVNKTIILENNTSYKTYILSAHIKADSFVYGLFDRDRVLHKVVEYTNVKSEGEVDFILGEIRSHHAIKNIVAYGGKPFLHTVDLNDQLVKYMPSFDDKYMYGDSLTGYPVYTKFGLNTHMNKIVDADLLTSPMVHISNLFSYYLYPNLDDKVHVHFEKDRLHITYLTPDHFLFYNQYHCEAKEDYLYWVLQAYQSLNLKTQVVPLIVSGAINRGGEVYELLHKYIEQIDFVGCSDFTIADQRYNGKEHIFFDLYNISLCE